MSCEFYHGMVKRTEKVDPCLLQGILDGDLDLVRFLLRDTRGAYKIRQLSDGDLFLLAPFSKKPREVYEFLRQFASLPDHVGLEWHSVYNLSFEKEGIPAYHDSLHFLITRRGTWSDISHIISYDDQAALQIVLSRSFEMTQTEVRQLTASPKPMISYMPEKKLIARCFQEPNMNSLRLLRYLEKHPDMEVKWSVMPTDFVLAAAPTDVWQYCKPCPALLGKTAREVRQRLVYPLAQELQVLFTLLTEGYYRTSCTRVVFANLLHKIDLNKVGLLSCAPEDERYLKFQKFFALYAKSSPEVQRLLLAKLAGVPELPVVYFDYMCLLRILLTLHLSDYALSLLLRKRTSLLVLYESEFGPLPDFCAQFPHGAQFQDDNRVTCEPHAKILSSSFLDLLPQFLERRNEIWRRVMLYTDCSHMFLLNAVRVPVAVKPRALLSRMIFPSRFAGLASLRQHPLPEVFPLKVSEELDMKLLRQNLKATYDSPVNFANAKDRLWLQYPGNMYYIDGHATYFFRSQKCANYFWTYVDRHDPHILLDTFLPSREGSFLSLEQIAHSIEFPNLVMIDSSVTFSNDMLFV